MFWPLNDGRLVNLNVVRIIEKLIDTDNNKFIIIYWTDQGCLRETYEDKDKWLRAYSTLESVVLHSY